MKARTNEMIAEGFESFDSLLKYMYQLQRLGIKTGLDHSRRLLNACGNPEKDLKIIHIAGTNGKGSVSAMIASILRAAGYKTGLYTSPHLLRFNERIRINGRPISDSDIVKFMSIYKRDIDDIEATFFETTTALALWYFKNSKTDVCVIETGLGGRLDSTNVVDPRLTVITPVDIDHAEYLGNTLEKIAFEKAGIIKKGVPLILAPQEESAKTVILKKAEEMKSQVHDLELAGLDNIVITKNGTTFNLNGDQFTTSIVGEHQAYNAGLAITAARQFDSSLSDKAIKEGLFKVLWPGRLQLLQSTPTVFYDVAHNPHGIAAVIKTMNKLGFKKITGMIALKGDKNLDTIAGALAGRFSELIAISVTGNDLIESGKLALELKKRGVECQDGGLDGSLMTGFLESLNHSDAGLIFGSHYIAEIVYRKFDFSFDNGSI